MTKQERNIMRKMGKKGGKARRKAMTPEQRQASARKAAKARWERESQSSQHCDEGWMNDFRFGESPDY